MLNNNDARGAGLARIFEMIDRWFRPGDHCRYSTWNPASSMYVQIARQQHRKHEAAGHVGIDDRWFRESPLQIKSATI